MPTHTPHASREMVALTVLSLTGGEGDYLLNLLRYRGVNATEAAIETSVGRLVAGGLLRYPTGAANTHSRTPAGDAAYAAAEAAVEDVEDVLDVDFYEDPVRADRDRRRRLDAAISRALRLDA